MANVRCPLLVGRDHEAGLLSEAVVRLAHLDGSATLLVGEAGIGKTRLANFAAAEAERMGVGVVSGRAVPEPVSSPLRPVAEAMLELTRDAPIPEADDPLAPYVPVLATLVPRWRPRDWRAPQESPLVMAEAVLRALERLGPKRGMLLILEDVHWADDATIGVVRFLADHVGGTPVGLVVTARTVDGRADVAELLGPNTEVHELHRLTPAATDAMARACLGRAVAGNLEDVIRDSGGLPLLVEDLLAAGGQGGVPQRFADTVRTRLGRLDATERSVLSAAAVLGHRFDWRLLAAITTSNEGAVIAALHRGAALQLLVPDGVGFAFRHALTRDVVLKEMSPIARQRFCLAAADAIRARSALGEVEAGLMVGRLLVEGGQPEQAAEVLLSTGRQALAQGMIAAAEPPLRQATELIDEGQLLGAEARYALARILLLAGQPAAAADVGTSALAAAESGDANLATHVRLLLARSAITVARWEAAQAHLRLIPGSLEKEPAVAAETAVLEAHIAMGTARPDLAVAAEHAASRAVGIARDAGRPDLECEALEVLGLCARMRDLDASVAALDRALQLARRANLPMQALHVLNELGSVEMLRDARADRLEEARREAAQVGALGLATSVSLNLAAVHVMTADFDEAIEIAEEVETSAARLGLVPIQAAAELMQGFAMAHLGKPREMEQHLRLAEALAPADTELRSGAWGIGRALCALLQEDRTGARRALAEARRVSPVEHARILNPYEGPELLLRAVAGDLAVAEAETATKRLVHAARWPELWTYSALAVTLGADAKHEAARAAATRAFEAGRPYPVFLALVQRLVAEAALRDGWCDPEPLLRSAEASFERLGLGRAANACRRLLTTSGSPAPRRRKTDASLHPTLLAAGVTVREAEVMDLLVERLSNREIAERLYLSPRTVEKHVAALLDKLGVERAALAHVARTLR